MCFSSRKLRFNILEAIKSVKNHLNSTNFLIISYPPSPLPFRIIRFSSARFLIDTLPDFLNFDLVTLHKAHILTLVLTVPSCYSESFTQKPNCIFLVHKILNFEV
uniref:(northern house mosquito) hypothetical protein n=1 Tax=Culex pipiens TaxID=7175 RepID=A0A8D8G7W6_CULPI